MIITKNTTKYRINADRGEDCTELAILEAGTWAPRSVLRIPNDDETVIPRLIEVLQNFIPNIQNDTAVKYTERNQVKFNKIQKKESNRIAKR